MILVTLTLDTVNVTNIIYGHKSGLTFASQLLKNETIRSENFFGEKLRGLQVFGYKVIKPEAIGWMYAYKG